MVTGAVFVPIFMLTMLDCCTPLPSLGVSLGLTVGTALGVSLGLTVGTALGVSLGVTVGTALGVSLGSTVGMAVVGKNDGVPARYTGASVGGTLISTSKITGSSTVL